MKTYKNSAGNKYGGRRLASVTSSLSQDANCFPKPHLTPHRGVLQHIPSNLAQQQHCILCMLIWGDRLASHFIYSQRH